MEDLRDHNKALSYARAAYEEGPEDFDHAIRNIYAAGRAAGEWKTGDATVIAEEICNRLNGTTLQETHADYIASVIRGYYDPSEETAAPKAKPKEYKCDECGGVFNTERSDEEANQEALELFGVENASTHPGMAVVCDDCFKEMFAPAASGGGEG